MLILRKYCFTWLAIPCGFITAISLFSGFTYAQDTTETPKDRVMVFDANNPGTAPEIKNHKTPPGQISSAPLLEPTTANGETKEKIRDDSSVKTSSTPETKTEDTKAPQQN